MKIVFLQKAFEIFPDCIHNNLPGLRARLYWDLTQAPYLGCCIPKVDHTTFVRQSRRLRYKIRMMLQQIVAAELFLPLQARADQHYKRRFPFPGMAAAAARFPDPVKLCRGKRHRRSHCIISILVGNQLYGHIEHGPMLPVAIEHQQPENHFRYRCTYIVDHIRKHLRTQAHYTSHLPPPLACSPTKQQASPIREFRLVFRRQSARTGIPAILASQSTGK